MPLPITERTVDAMYEEVVSAWASHMTTNLPDVKLAYENVNFDPDEAFGTNAGDSDAFVRFNMQHTPGEGGAAGVGNKYFRRFGVVIAQVFTRAGTGRVLSNEIVEQVLLFLETTSVSGIWFRGQSPSEAGNDGSWYQVNVSADFEYDTLRT